MAKPEWIGPRLPQILRLIEQGYPPAPPAHGKDRSSDFKQTQSVIVALAAMEALLFKKNGHTNAMIRKHTFDLYRARVYEILTGTGEPFRLLGKPPSGAQHTRYFQTTGSSGETMTEAALWSRWLTIRNDTKALGKILLSTREANPMESKQSHILSMHITWWIANTTLGANWAKTHPDEVAPWPSLVPARLKSPRSWLVFTTLGEGSASPLELLSPQGASTGNPASGAGAAAAAVGHALLQVVDVVETDCAVDAATSASLADVTAQEAVLVSRTSASLADVTAQEAVLVSRETLCVEREKLIVSEMATVLQAMQQEAQAIVDKAQRQAAFDAAVEARTGFLKRLKEQQDASAKLCKKLQSQRVELSRKRKAISTPQHDSSRAKPAL